MTPIFYRIHSDDSLIQEQKIIEHTEYIIEIQAEKVFFRASPLERYKSYSYKWKCKTPFAVGKSAQLHWIWEEKEYQEQIVIHAHPDKIEDRSLWQNMLEDLLDWSESLLGHQGVRDANVGIGDLNHYLMLEALYPLLERFIRSLEHLFENLRERSITPDTSLHLLELRAPFPLQQIATNPNAIAWIQGKQGTGAIPIIDAPFVTQTYDHPVNRYIRWLVEKIVYNVFDAVDKLLHIDFTKDKTSNEMQWRKYRADILKQEGMKLQQLLWNSPLANVSSSPMEDAAFLVILNDPLYAEVHRYGRLLCYHTLNIQDGAFAASMSRSFDIYEIWCFQEIVAQFKQVLHTSPVYKFNSKEQDNPHWGTIAIFDTDNAQIMVEYNATFTANFSLSKKDGPPKKRYSILNTQRPDIVVYYQKNAHKVWVALDAKYRTSKENVSKAFSSAFAYNQTLFDPNFNSIHIDGAPLGCYLLVPKKLHETAHWFGTEFASRYQFGVFEYRPSKGLDQMTNSKEIVTFLLTQLQYNGI